MKNLITVSLLLLFIIACSAEKQLLKEAQETNSVERYETFLEKYPNSEFYAEAKTELMKAKYDKTKKTGTIEAYEKFLREFPEDFNKEEKKEITWFHVTPEEKLKKERKDMILKATWSLERLKREKAIKLNTVEAYEQYLKDYPDNYKTRDMKDKIMDLTFNEAEEKNTIESYMKFLSKYPGAYYWRDINRVRSAKKNIVNILKETNSIEVCEEFLNKYPNSEFISPAEDKIVDIIFERESKTVNNVVFSKNDKIRKKDFGVFLTKYASYQSLIPKALQKFNEYFFTKCNENESLVPYSTSNNSFFNYYFGLTYYPTIYNSHSFKEDSYNSLMSLLNFISFYFDKDNYDYESLYLSHHIGRISVLLLANKQQGSFTDISLADFQEILRQDALLSLASSFTKSYDKGYSGKRLLSLFSKEYAKTERLNSVHKISYGVFIDKMGSNMSYKSKNFLLKKFREWMKIIGIYEKNHENKLFKMIDEERNKNNKVLGNRILDDLKNDPKIRWRYKD